MQSNSVAEWMDLGRLQDKRFGFTQRPALAALSSGERQKNGTIRTDSEWPSTRTGLTGRSVGVYQTIPGLG